MIFAFPVHFYDAGERNRSQLRVSQWGIRERGAPGVESDGRCWRLPWSQPGSSVGGTAGSLVQRVSRAQSSGNEGCASYLQQVGRQIFQGTLLAWSPETQGLPQRQTCTVAKKGTQGPPVGADCPPSAPRFQSRERTTLDGMAPRCQCSFAAFCCHKHPWNDP